MRERERERERETETERQRERGKERQRNREIERRPVAVGFSRATHQDKTPLVVAQIRLPWPLHWFF